MPSGSGSGIVQSVTFTPNVSGRVIVTCTYEAQGSVGSNWGASFKAHAFLAQSGTTTLGDPSGVSTTRTAGVVRGVFNVVAGVAVECGLWGYITGAVGSSYWNVKVTAEHIKR